MFAPINITYVSHQKIMLLILVMHTIKIFNKWVFLENYLLYRGPPTLLFSVVNLLFVQI